MKILILSHICIDQNSIAGREYEYWGSPGMYIGFLYKNYLKCDYTVIGSYGSDFESFKFGINIYPETPNQSGTMINSNITDDTTKEAKQYSKKREYGNLVEVDDYLISQIKDADAIIIAPLLPNISHEKINAIFSYCKPDCVKVLIAQGYFRGFNEKDEQYSIDFKDSQRIISKFDFVILSDHEHPDIYEIIRDKNWRSRTKTVITEGSRGARFIDINDELFVPVDKEDNVVDSTGAGDVFSGAFVYKYILTKNLRASIEFGNRFAREFIKVTPQQMSSVD